MYHLWRSGDLFFKTTSLLSLQLGKLRLEFPQDGQRRQHAVGPVLWAQLSTLRHSQVRQLHIVSGHVTVAPSRPNLREPIASLSSICAVVYWIRKVRHGGPTVTA